MNEDIIEVKFRIAVKAFIVNKGKLLLVKRAEEDVQSPAIWEIPGGRLELGEDPFIGLIREINEETGLYIDPVYLMNVRHFKRADGQIITMLIFFCKPKAGNIKLSEEHTAYSWVNIEESKEKITSFFHKEIDIFNELNLYKFS